MTVARRASVLYIRISEPAISSGARVPIRRNTWVRRLDNGGIAAQPHHQLAGVEFIEVAVRESLNAHKQRFAQVARDAFTGQNRKIIVTERKQSACNRNAKHDRGSFVDNLVISGMDAIVNNPLHQARDGQIHEHHGGQQEQRALAGFNKVSEKGKVFGYSS